MLGLLGACARSPLVPLDTAQLPTRFELEQTPFFPQEDYQCGPAALATVLAQRGIDTDPERLVGRVYIPERKGSLQVEMVAAARAHDLLVYRLSPRLESVLAEVAAGNPVLVLQNLAFDRWPQWHFAVVVGYDLTDQTIVLRSGTTRRWVGSFRQFERGWMKGDRWAVVTTPPDMFPSTVEETRWLQAASDLEQTGRNEAARRAYRAAVDRWSSGLSWFALGNGAYAAGDREDAELALRRSVQKEPGFAAGWSNLAHVLAERGCRAQAIQAQQCAARQAPAEARLVTGGLPATVEVAACSPVPECPR